MSLNLLYGFREGWKGLRRARLASIVTITTVALMLFILGLFVLVTVNIHQIVETFKKKMSFEVFIDNSLNPSQIDSLRQHLSRVPGVQQAVFISKNEALRKFQQEYGDDLVSLLGENPLPPSFQIILRSSYRTPERAEAVVRRIQFLEGVDEVVYRGKLFSVVDQWSRIVLIVDFGLLVLVFIAALMLIGNTLRLTISAQSKNIQIMRLVGAKTMFIRLPYMIQGMLEGGLGGAISSAALWLVYKGVFIRFASRLHGVEAALSAPFILGIILGVLGSYIGLKRFLKV
jgi:cell division transport system permease protein